MAKLTPDEQMTCDTYDAHAAAWSGQHKDPAFWKVEMDTFQSLLPKGDIIEIATGGGRDAQQLIARGFSYTGTDISLGLVELARKRLPGVEIVHQSVYDLDFGVRKFDGFWASAVLLHIPKDRIDEALQRMRGVLCDGAIGFISLKEGEGERIAGAAGIDRRLFVYYSRDEFASVLARNGFEIADYTYHPMSQKTKWLCFFVRKPPSTKVDTNRYEQEFKAAGLEYEYGEDKPGYVYTPHRHGWTKLVTLGGSIRLRTGAGWRELREGDECEIQSDELHEAVVGDKGWKWLAAWKPDEADTFSVHE